MGRAADIDACWDIENTAEWEQKTKGQAQWLHKQKTVISSTGSKIIRSIWCGVYNSGLLNAEGWNISALKLGWAACLSNGNTYKCTEATVFHTCTCKQTHFFFCAGSLVRFAFKVMPIMSRITIKLWLNAVVQHTIVPLPAPSFPPPRGIRKEGGLPYLKGQLPTLLRH